MTFDLDTLFLVSLAYLSTLFLIAYAADKGWIPERIVRHPATYVLSLGVYTTSWSYYGSVGFAENQGFLFLTIYLGPTLAFIHTPVLLAPLLRLIRDYQLTSLADLFAFRYRSQRAGILVTLFMLVGTLPYIALQIRAVTESLQVLSQETTPQIIALGFCLTLILFAILFGARHISPREKHRGLVAAIAFESLIKLLALGAIGLFALFGIFAGPAGLNRWLVDHPEAIENLFQPMREGPWATPPDELPVGETGRLVAVGSGCRYLERFPFGLQRVVSATVPDLLPRAKEMVPLVQVLFEEGTLQSPGEIQPVYVRDEISWKKVAEQGRRQ